ncbi:hypothetical protein [uncultured Microbulbifer sp.]|uniref:hypothetical protein n=1 Tax=uncultured Microbulbifer sp. TaxID=348147 RepID=UPI00261CF008|nr:hypothetical protein [uncultured Microbulbifer sp.]
MRRFVSLKSEKQDFLLHQFPNLMEIDACEDGYGYTKIAVSYFDHWLSESEAYKAFLNVGLEESVNRKNKQLEFCRQLFNSTEVLNYKIYGRPNNRRVKFRAFSDDNVALRYCSDAYDKFSSIFFFKLVIPEYSALYYQGYDATNYLYYRGGELSNKLKSLVYGSGLNVLE